MMITAMILMILIMNIKLILIIRVFNDRINIETLKIMIMEVLVTITVIITVIMITNRKSMEIGIAWKEKESLSCTRNWSQSWS